MKKSVKMMVAGLAGAGMTMVAPLVGTAATEAPDSATFVVEGNEILVSEAQAPADVVAVHNVVGEFAYNQDEVTPGDEVFNIFGSTVESMCAKPRLAASDGSRIASYYVNIGGDIKKAYTVNIADMAKTDGVENVMVCSCGSTGALAQAAVVGVPIEHVIQMADLEDGVNTFTAYGADGYGIPMPLSYVLANKAMLAFEVGGEALDGSVQLWMPKTVAAYFTRDVVSIELTKSEAEPTVSRGSSYQDAKVNIVNTSDSALFHVGDDITFTGHADDLGVPISAIEVSLDGGQTWTVCLTDGATADRWVSWSFTTQVAEPGTYEFSARAITADGNISPVSATALFTVVE